MNKTKKVMITGVGGMDGSILADKYLAKGYEVFGIDRWYPTGMSINLKTALEYETFTFISGDICEHDFITRNIKEIQPNYFFNMAAISLVPESFKIPQTVFKTNCLAVINILEAIRTYSPTTKFYQASTSEQIGSNIEHPQNTESMMLPNSPYAIAKLSSYHMVRSYRKAFGLFASNGMLWNHEGPRRGPAFVTRKITLGVSAIDKGQKQFISLGNLDSSRDWGLADNFCDAMMLIMEADEPDDYAINTGETHTIREFVVEAFRHIGKKIVWIGSGLDEIGVDQDGIVRVKINERYYRPVEVPYLHGDHTKAKEKLGWTPTTKFKELVKIMMMSDLGVE